MKLPLLQTAAVCAARWNRHDAVSVTANRSDSVFLSHLMVLQREIIKHRYDYLEWPNQIATAPCGAVASRSTNLAASSTLISHSVEAFHLLF